jgi:hypothetical protein
VRRRRSIAADLADFPRFPRFPRSPPILILAGLLSMMLAGRVLHAGPEGGGPAAPLAVPPPATPAAPAPVTPGARVATGQAPVVGGNAAGARERALDEAMRQAVDLALADLADAPTRAAQAKAIKAIEARARSFVPRYRTLEEGEANGVYSVRIEAEVDEVALRRKIERWTGPSSSAAPPPPGIPGLLIFAGDRGQPTADLVKSLMTALPPSTMRARLAEGADFTAASAVQAAARASFGNAALVSATLTDEGDVRGTGQVATSCRASARLMAAPSGSALGERAATARVFADRAEPGRGACLARLARDLADQVGAALSASVGAGSGDLRVLTLDADVVEPQVVSALLKSVRSVGAVSAADLQRVGAGHAEIRVRTRAAPGPLAAALARDVDALITLSDVQITTDAIHLRARLSAPVSPPPGSNP